MAPVVCIFCRTPHPHGIACMRACEADIDRTIAVANAAITRTNAVVAKIRAESQTRIVAAPARGGSR